MSDRAIIPEVYEPDESLPSDLRTLRRFANLMDNAVRIPGTSRGIGLDAAVGLIPGVGDALGAIFSSWIVVGALRHRVPPSKITRMVVNILIDLLIGLIPVAGDVFDFFFTENVSNVEMLIRYRDRTRPPRSYGSIALVFLLVFAVIALLTLAVVVYLIVGLVQFSRSL